MDESQKHAETDPDSAAGRLRRFESANSHHSATVLKRHARDGAKSLPPTPEENDLAQEAAVYAATEYTSTDFTSKTGQTEKRVGSGEATHGGAAPDQSAETPPIG